MWADGMVKGGVTAEEFLLYQVVVGQVFNPSRHVSEFKARTARAIQKNCLKRKKEN